ncbi:MAG: ISKra4 family transposase, partial [Bacteroidota bacterium]
QAREKNLPIGSGVVEAACKVLVKQRLGISGCRWTRDGIDNVLVMRALVLTPGRYEQFWKKFDQIPN